MMVCKNLLFYRDDELDCIIELNKCQSLGFYSERIEEKCVGTYITVAI